MRGHCVGTVRPPRASPCGRSMHVMWRAHATPGLCRGGTMFCKWCYLRDHADGLRKRMLREPRGYPAANCNLILPPTHPDAQAGYVIMEQVEYPGMSGTNTICVTTVLLETGMVPMKEPVTELVLESPAGLIRVRAE